MEDKLLELAKKFNCENNVTGERMSIAVKNYLDIFTNELKERQQSEQSNCKKNVNKIINFLIDCEAENEYIARHIYPLFDRKEYYIIKRQMNDQGVIERLNSGIANNQGSGVSSRITVGFVYMDLSYEELSKCKENPPKLLVKIEDRSGVTYTLDCYLTWSDEGLRLCKKMWNLSKIYDDETPIIFAPYAIRFFEIEVDIEQLLSKKSIQIENVDLKVAETQYKDKVLFNKELVWNVKIENKLSGIEPKHSKVSPVGDVIHWRYSFKELSDNQYIIPNSIKWPSYRIICYETKTLEYDFEYEYSGGFERVTIYDLKSEDLQNKEIFETGYNEKNLEMQYRLRSLADVEFELKKFNPPDGISIDGISIYISENKNILEKKNQMTVYDQGRFGYRNTNKIYVNFSGDEKDVKFFEYMRYVLSYLIYSFPEIGWEGVY